MRLNAPTLIRCTAWLAIMKLSKLIKTLRKAQKQFGDVPVNLMDEESGNWHPLAEVLKLHPYTAEHGCLNRAEPVNAIALTRSGGNAPDLVLANDKLSDQSAYNQNL